jgi:hypothetical protein
MRWKSLRPSQTHRRALQPGVAIGRLPRLVRQRHGTVSFTAPGHRTFALWPCSVKSGHVNHLLPSLIVRQTRRFVRQDGLNALLPYG